MVAIDQGTTSSRVILFSRRGEILATKQKELKLHHPHNGWVEQNPEYIWTDTLWALQGVLKNAENIAAIGIANQRETTIIWNRKTGKPVYQAIVWQDRRTADLCQKLKAAGHESMIRERTGLLLDPYFSATKIDWILSNVEGARAKAEAGELAFGTVDSWLLWNLTGGEVHATDATNASRTMLFNIRTQDWDEQLLALFNIPKAMLPTVKDNAADFGHTNEKICGRKIAIGGMVGDQQAALIGQACFEEGMVKSTYGTGCFVLMNIGKTFFESKNRLLTTTAYRLGDRLDYAIEGSIFVAGAAVQWLRDGLGLFKDVSESEALATSVNDNNGVYFIPAFTGLGAPHWDPDARASITGLTSDSTSAHITRAVLEAQAYQTLDLMEAMQADTGHVPDVIRADGGLMNNAFVCQFLADMLGKSVEIQKSTEITALGAAYLAGLQAGVYNDLSDLSKQHRCERRYTPHLDSGSRLALYDGWKRAVTRLIG